MKQSPAELAGRLQEEQGVLEAKSNGTFWKIAEFAENAKGKVN